MTHRPKAWASALAVALILTGCSPAPDPPASIAWTPCGTLECARVEVPLDHGDPQGPHLALAVQRRAATTEPHRGVLFVNPGGPAVSGRAFLEPLAGVGLAGYDLVSWDTRGTGESAGVDCLPDAGVAALLALDASPDSPAESDALRESERGLADACVEAAGADLLAHLSSDDTARDLELLRAALGDGRFNYVGWSYGTLPGVRYAALHPDRVGRLVLDSPVDVAGDGPSPLIGADRALERFARWCEGSTCPLGSDAAAVTASVAALLDGLDARPLSVDGRSLSQTEATYGVWAHLASGRAAWPALADAVRAALAGDGAALLAAVDAQNGRLPSGQYDATLTSRLATVCADTPPSDAAALAERRERDREQAPFFSRYLSDDFGCGAWPAPGRPRAAVPNQATAPILVVGGLGDPVTPHEHAQTLAERLDNATLLTWTGDGHAVFGSRSECVDQAVVTYLTTGETPASGARCP